MPKATTPKRAASKVAVTLAMSASEEVLRTLSARGPQTRGGLVRLTGRRQNSITRALRSLVETGHVVEEGGRFSATGLLTPLETAIIQYIESKGEVSAEDVFYANEVRQKTDLPRKVYFGLHRLVGAGYLEEIDAEEIKLWRKRYRMRSKSGALVRMHPEDVEAAPPSGPRGPAPWRLALETAAAHGRFRKASKRLEYLKPVLAAPAKTVMLEAKKAAEAAGVTVQTILEWLERFDDRDPLGSLEPHTAKKRERWSGPDYRPLDNRRCVSLASPGMRSIVDALFEHGPMTCREIAEKATISLKTLQSQNYLADLCATGKIHVCDWRRSGGGPWAPVFKIGKGENVPRPVKQTNAQIKRNKREALKRSKEHDFWGRWSGILAAG